MRGFFYFKAMRTLVQRVSNATVEVKNNVVGEIGRGLLVFVGFEASDEKEDIDWMINKLLNLRIFNDNAGKMNISVKDIAGEALIVSQFTLHAQTKKGNRPSYNKAASPQMARQRYNEFIEAFKAQSDFNVETGEFGSDMQVNLTNDGPVTIWIDTKNKE